MPSPDPVEAQRVKGVAYAEPVIGDAPGLGLFTNTKQGRVDCNPRRPTIRGLHVEEKNEEAKLRISVTIDGKAFVGEMTHGHHGHDH